MSDARNRMARDYIAAFEADGSRAYVENLETTVGLHQWGEHVLPVTINNGERIGTFVCSPRVHYIDYPMEEMAHFPNRAVALASQGVIAGVGAFLSLSDVNRIVHVNNWMISTNLPVDLDLSLTSRQTELLTALHPTHILSMRSLTRRHSAGVMNALAANGWLLLPARQISLVDDVARESLPRRDTKRDHRIWRLGAYACEELDEVTAADAARIVELYNMLYLEKHSRLNPAYTTRFVLLTHRIGMIRYLVLRDNDGVIQGFGGMHRLGRHGTMPLLGYNTRLKQELGLYRLSFHAGSLYAARHELLFNMSSGATAYKCNRGATTEIEFTAFYLRHLPRSRRLPFGMLNAVAQHIGVPILKKHQL